MAPAGWTRLEARGRLYQRRSLAESLPRLHTQTVFIYASRSWISSGVYSLRSIP